MEPATHRIRFDATADPVLARLEAELSQQGDPPIRMHREVLFECDTAEFMLQARVAQALMGVCGHDTWQRLFRPLD